MKRKIEISTENANEIAEALASIFAPNFVSRNLSNLSGRCEELGIDITVLEDCRKAGILKRMDQSTGFAQVHYERRATSAKGISEKIANSKKVEA